MTGAGIIVFSRYFSLPNTLLVSSLSSKLLSIRQMTEELSSYALMYPTFFFLFQDILTKGLLVVVLKGRDCITWMISVMVEQILFILLKLRKPRFGYGIIGWGIPHFGI